MNAITQYTEIVHTDINKLISECNNKLDKNANAVSASKLAKDINFSLSGDVTGSVSFNGSSNVTLSTTVADDSHNHNKITSSTTTGTYINGNKGVNVIINSTAGAGAYTTVLRYPSTNGVFTFSGHQQAFNLNYTTNSVINAGTNTTTYSVQLLNESGNTVIANKLQYANGTQIWIA